MSDSVLRGIYDQLDRFLETTQSLSLTGDLETQFSAVNVIPGTQDIPFVNAIVSERAIQLSTLASQMEKIHSIIQKLAVVRTRLEENSACVRQSLMIHRALISRRIPPEVLGEVFYHCLPKTSYIVPRDIESPMVLTQVCRHWRAVALSTPCLWSSLSIHLDKIVSDESYRHGCEAWLTRAKSIPLSLRAFNDINMIAEDPTQVKTAVHWLRPLISNSSDIWWHGPPLPALFTSDTGTEVDLPLEHLRITTYRDSPAIYIPGPARRLRRASLQCLNFDLRSLDGISLPWDHLVELNMHFAFFSSTLFTELLMHCNSLHTLIVSCLCADDIDLDALNELTPGSISHPTLRRIEIKVIRAGLDAIFNALTLPALEELDISFCYRERDSWPHAPFMGMVQRSRCSLKRLVVRSNKNAVSHFEEYTKAMPKLAVFTSMAPPLSR